MCKKDHHRKFEYTSDVIWKSIISTEGDESENFTLFSECWADTKSAQEEVGNRYFIVMDLSSSSQKEQRLCNLYILPRHVFSYSHLVSQQCTSSTLSSVPIQLGFQHSHSAKLGMYYTPPDTSSRKWRTRYECCLAVRCEKRWRAEIVNSTQFHHL